VLLLFSCCVTVHCRCPPEFIFVSENETVEAGDDVELVCRFISGEAAHVMWLKHYTVNGSYVDENNKPHYNILPVLPIGIIHSLVTLTLDVNNLNDDAHWMFLRRQTRHDGKHRTGKLAWLKK